MAYCGECNQECSVKIESDHEGGGMYWREIREAVSECCGGEVFADEECTIPIDPWDYDSGSDFDEEFA